MFVFLFAAALPAVAANDDRGVSASRPSEQARSLQAKVDKVEPANQGISPRDLITTRDINQLISYSNNLSVAAHDVRVNTYRGRVTLRGAVVSLDEKQQIEAMALSVAGPGNILDELKVRPALARY
jgi:osmotically-inducible protein OsmY